MKVVVQAYYGYCDRSKQGNWVCYGTPYGTKQKLKISKSNNKSHDTQIYLNTIYTNTSKTH